MGPRSEYAPVNWKDFLDRWRASVLSDDDVLRRHKLLMADARLTLTSVVGTIGVAYFVSVCAQIPLHFGVTSAGAVVVGAAVRTGWKAITRRRTAARQPPPSGARQ